MVEHIEARYSMGRVSAHKKSLRRDMLRGSREKILKILEIQIRDGRLQNMWFSLLAIFIILRL